MLLTNTESPYRLVGRIKSTNYFTSKGFAVKKEFNVLKRKSDVSANDWLDDLDLELPVNFHELEDGLYEMIALNMYPDYETGVVDDWDWKLVPYTEGSYDGC